MHLRVLDQVVTAVDCGIRDAAVGFIQLIASGRFWAEVDGIHLKLLTGIRFRRTG